MWLAGVNVFVLVLRQSIENYACSEALVRKEEERTSYAIRSAKICQIWLQLTILSFLVYYFYRFIPCISQHSKKVLHVGVECVLQLGTYCVIWNKQQSERLGNDILPQTNIYRSKFKFQALILHQHCWGNLVGSVGRVPDYRGRGRGSKPRPDQYSGL